MKLKKQWVLLKHKAREVGLDGLKIPFCLISYAFSIDFKYKVSKILKTNIKVDNILILLYRHIIFLQSSIIWESRELIFIT